MPELFWFVLIPVFAGIVGYLLPERVQRPLAVVFQSVYAVGAVLLFIRVAREGGWSAAAGRHPGPLGVTLTVDRLSGMLVMLTAALLLVFLLYNLSRPYVRRLFLTLLLVLQGLLIGIFLSGDLFNIYILVELSTVVVTFLIQFRQDDRSSYDGLVYLMLNLFSMTFFLFGLGMLYRLTGVVDLASLADAVSAQPRTAPLILPYALLITGVSLKSAFFPLSAWLARAHGTPGAPTVVSALLSGLYIKMGLYLFLRIQALFSPKLDTAGFFLAVGLLTGLAGVVFALRESDIKRFLAFSTISQIGLILIGVSRGGGDAYWGGIYHMVSHSLFKSTLFLAAGLIADRYGTRDMNRIRGVFRAMPAVSTAVVLALLGVTGAPLFNGSISKELMKSGWSGTAMEIALLLINLGTAVYAVRFAVMLTGPAQDRPGSVPRTRRAILLLLGAACFLGGLLGGPAVGFLLGVRMDMSAARTVTGALIYAATLAVALLLHRVLPRAPGSGRPAWMLRWDFNQMVLGIAGYLGALLLYMGLFGPAV